MSVDTDVVMARSSDIQPGDIQKMLRDAIAVALAGRRLVAGTAIMTAVLAILVLRMIEPSFTAVLIVGPTAAEGLLGRGTPLPDLPAGSLVNAAVHGAGERMSYYERFLYEMTSLSVANELATAPEIMRRVFEPMWDAEAQAWVPDPGPVPRLRRMLSDLVGRRSWSVPDGRDLVRYLRSRILVQQIGNTPMRRISYRHPDPEFARLLLNRLYAVSERQLRAIAVRGNSTMIDEYERMIRVASDLEHKSALRATLIGHERFAMMMNVDLPLAADLLEPAVTDALPDTPDPAMVLPIAIAAGLVLGLILVFVRSVPETSTRFFLSR
jgi:uncharacterized protein involved in exopolysaccharide biosynthesis